MTRSETEIKGLILCWIFVCRFHGHVGGIVDYATQVSVENTDKKTTKIGILINATFLRTGLKICIKSRNHTLH